MFERNIKNIIAKLFSMGVAFGATLVITRVVVQSSGNELYGFYAMSADFVNYAAILSVALNSMAGRFITVKYYKNDIVAVNRLFNTIFYANVVLAAFFVILMIGILIHLENLISINESYIDDVKGLFLMMFINYIITIISSVFSVSTFIKNRVDLDSIRQGEGNLIKLIIIYVLYYVLTPNVIYIGIGTIISTLYIWIVNIRYVKKLTPEIVMFQQFSIVWLDLKDLLLSGIWNSISRIGAVILNGLDLIIANQFIGSMSLGILSIAKTLPKYFYIAAGSFATVFFPGITIAYAKGDIDELLKKTIFSIKVCTFISNTIFTVLIALGERIYKVWLPGQDVINIYYITVITVLGLVVVMPMEPFWAVFTATNKVKLTSLYLIIESIFTLSIVITFLHIIKNDSARLMIIAGVSSIFEILRGLLFMPIYASEVLNINRSYFYPTIIRIIISFIITTGVGITISKLIDKDGGLILLTMIVILSIISFIMNLLIVIDREERTDIVHYLLNWRKN